MPAALILNQSQAEAVYSAMCALNNVGGRLVTRIKRTERTQLKVSEHHDGGIFVYEMLVGDWEPCERYENQAAFATAYGLNSDEWQSDVAAAAGGLTQTAIER